MTTTMNGRVLFSSIPTGYPEPGKTTVYDTSQTIDLENVPLEGGCLVKTLELSIDPYMRSRMRDPSTKSYSAAFELGAPMNGHGVGIVLRSENSNVKAGDHIYGSFQHTHYIVIKNFTGYRILQNKFNLPWSVYVGPAGMPGQTAFMAWREYAHSKKGETVFVTTGGGPVGSLVIQLAKLDGLKVIASAGSDEKVQFMKSIGADVAFNYKTMKTAEVLEKEGPIDVYWDNVGGEILDAALQNAAIGARFIECGMISDYNKNGQPVKNLMQIVAKSITMQGFLVSNLEAKYEEQFEAFMLEALATGSIKYQEHVFQGLESVGEALLAVQTGKNTGKAVVHVAEE